MQVCTVLQLFIITATLHYESEILTDLYFGSDVGVKSPYVFTLFSNYMVTE